MLRHDIIDSNVVFRILVMIGEPIDDKDRGGAYENLWNSFIFSVLRCLNAAFRTAEWNQQYRHIVDKH